MGAFSNFAVSFTIISILSGCLTLFGYGMYVGGPASSAYGWPLVGILVTFVALAMAEICSSYPTAGGLYYWSAKVAPKNGPAWAWFTGWFNLLGQVAVTAGIDFGFAAFFVCAPALRVQGRRHEVDAGVRVHRRPGGPRADEHVRHQARGAAERRQRVVAHRAAC